MFKALNLLACRGCAPVDYDTQNALQVPNGSPNHGRVTWECHRNRIPFAPGPSPRTSVLNRLPNPLCDHRRVVGGVECHGAVEPLRSGDQHSHAAPKWIRSNPGFKTLLSKTGRNLATRVAIKGFACPELEF